MTDAVLDDAMAIVVRRRADRLEEIFDEYEEEPVFETIREKSSGLVIGAGNVMARIMFIGFSPGETEDETGLPFSGSSGDVLAELLSSIGKKRSEVYCTNVVKYRLTDKDDLMRVRQINTAMRYLRREIAVIKPNVIVTLGADALRQFDTAKKLSVCHGRIINKRDRSIVPMYHPASVLRDESKRAVLMADIGSVAQAASGYVE